MPECRLTLALERSEKKYQAGETINGTVRVEVDQEVSDRPLVMQLIYETHGRGSTKGELVESVSVKAPLWRPGEPSLHPFSFTVPQSPLTYHGHYLNIDYYVTARADLSWKIDPRTKEKILVLPGPESREKYRDQEGPPTDAAPVKLGLAWRIIGWILVFLVLAMLVIYFAAFGLIFGLLALAVKVRKNMIAKRLGTVETTCETRLTPGQKLPVRLRFNPSRDTPITTITAILTGQEEITHGSGDDKRRFRHELHKETVIVAQAFTAPGQSFQDFRFVLQIPEIDAYSFHSLSDRLTWDLALRIEMSGFPDWKKNIKLLVVPENTVLQVF